MQKQQCWHCTGTWLPCFCFPFPYPLLCQKVIALLSKECVCEAQQGHPTLFFWSGASLALLLLKKATWKGCLQGQRACSHLQGISLLRFCGGWAEPQLQKVPPTSHTTAGSMPSTLLSSLALLWFHISWQDTNYKAWFWCQAEKVGRKSSSCPFERYRWFDAQESSYQELKWQDPSTHEALVQAFSWYFALFLRLIFIDFFFFLKEQTIKVQKDKCLIACLCSQIPCASWNRQWNFTVVQFDVFIFYQKREIR